MLPDNDRIDNSALYFLIVTIIIESGILEGPRVLAKEAGASAWLVALFNVVPVLTSCFFLVRLGQLFPGETFPEYSRKIVGPWLSYLCCFILIGYWLVTNGRVLRSFSGLIKTFILFRTPIEVVMITFLLAAAYLARGGIEAIARFATIATIISVPIGILLILTTYGQWDVNHLLPLFEKGWQPVVVDSIKNLSVWEGLESLLILLAFVRKPEKSLPYCIGGVLTVSFLYSFTIIATLLSFGPQETARLTIPGVSLIQSAVLPGRFLERLGSIHATIWIIILFPTVVAFLYLPGLVLAKLFRPHEVRPLIFFFIPIVYLIALIPPNREAVFALNQFMVPVNLGIIGGSPAVFYLIARLRGYKRCRK